MPDNYLQAAVEIARQAGQILREEFARPVNISYKGDEVDLVTQADKRSEPQKGSGPYGQHLLDRLPKGRGDRRSWRGDGRYRTAGHTRPLGVCRPVSRRRCRVRSRQR